MQHLPQANRVLVSGKRKRQSSAHMFKDRTDHLQQNTEHATLYKRRKFHLAHTFDTSIFPFNVDQKPCTHKDMSQFWKKGHKFECYACEYKLNSNAPVCLSSLQIICGLIMRNNEFEMLHRAYYGFASTYFCKWRGEKIFLCEFQEKLKESDFIHVVKSDLNMYPGSTPQLEKGYKLKIKCHRVQSNGDCVLCTPNGVYTFPTEKGWQLWETRTVTVSLEYVLKCIYRVIVVCSDNLQPRAIEGLPHYMTNYIVDSKQESVFEKLSNAWVFMENKDENGFHLSPKIHYLKFISDAAWEEYATGKSDVLELSNYSYNINNMKLKAMLFRMILQYNRHVRDIWCGHELVVNENSAFFKNKFSNGEKQSPNSIALYS